MAQLFRLSFGQSKSVTSFESLWGMTSGAVVRDSSTQRLEVFIKGSYEKVKDRNHLEPKCTFHHQFFVLQDLWGVNIISVQVIEGGWTHRSGTAPFWCPVGWCQCNEIWVMAWSVQRFAPVLGIASDSASRLRPGSRLILKPGWIYSFAKALSSRVFRLRLQRCPLKCFHRVPSSLYDDSSCSDGFASHSVMTMLWGLYMFVCCSCMIQDHCTVSVSVAWSFSLVLRPDQLLEFDWKFGLFGFGDQVEYHVLSTGE